MWPLSKNSLPTPSLDAWRFHDTCNRSQSRGQKKEKKRWPTMSLSRQQRSLNVPTGPPCSLLWILSVCVRECGPPKLLLPVHCSDGPSIFMAFARCTALMYLVYVSSPLVLVPLMFTLIPLIHFEMRRAITWTCLLPS